MVSDLGEYAYVHNPAPTVNTITRYYSSPTSDNSSTGKWNPNGRVITDASSATNLYASSLLAEGVVGFNMVYYATPSSVGQLTWDSKVGGAQDGQIPALVEVTMLAVDSRTAARLPAADPARANAISQFGRTNTAVIRLQNAQ